MKLFKSRKDDEIDRLKKELARFKKCTPALAIDREAMMVEIKGLRESNTLYCKACSGYERRLTESRATIDRLTTENERLKADNDYLAELVKAKTEVTV